jgi:hypothetical protein
MIICRKPPNRWEKYTYTNIHLTTCRFNYNHSRNIGKCGKLVVGLKWDSEHIMRGRLPTLKIASRQYGSSWLWRWLANDTYVHRELVEIKLGYGCLSSFLSSLSTYSLPETETPARQRKQACHQCVTNCWWVKLFDRDRFDEPCILLAPPPVPRFPARHSPELQSSLCQFKPKILRIDSLGGHVIHLPWSTLLPSLHHGYDQWSTGGRVGHGLWLCFLDVQSLLCMCNQRGFQSWSQIDYKPHGNIPMFCSTWCNQTNFGAQTIQ